jgi:hypothetical protein
MIISSSVWFFFYILNVFCFSNAPEKLQDTELISKQTTSAEYCGRDWHFEGKNINKINSIKCQRLMMHTL